MGIGWSNLGDPYPRIIPYRKGILRFDFTTNFYLQEVDVYKPKQKLLKALAIFNECTNDFLSECPLFESLAQEEMNNRPHNQRIPTSFLHRVRSTENSCL